MKNKITVYGTSACPFCTLAKQYLDKKKVKYRDVDVSKNHEKAHEMIEKSGQMGVPVIDINGMIIIGFNRVAIDNALAQF